MAACLAVEIDQCDVVTREGVQGSIGCLIGASHLEGGAGGCYSELYTTNALEYNKAPSGG